MQRNRSKTTTKRAVKTSTTKRVTVQRLSNTSVLRSAPSKTFSTSAPSISKVKVASSPASVVVKGHSSSNVAVTKRTIHSVSSPTKISLPQATSYRPTPTTFELPKAPIHTVPAAPTPKLPQIKAPQPQAIKPIQQPSRPFSSTFEPAPDNGTTAGPGGIKRPISPSIQIWKFTPAAYAHVGVRIAGAVLTGGFTIAGLTALFGTCDIPHVLDQVKIHTPILVPLLKASIVAPTVYHTLGGFRQLYLDFTAKGYTFKFQDQSSLGIAVLTLLTTLYFGAT